MAGKKKRKLRLNRRYMLFLVLSLAILFYLLLRLIPEKTLLLETTSYAFSTDATVYAFKDEDYIILNSSEMINMLVEEGTDVSGSEVLSDNYVITDKTYLQEKIDALEFMIENPSIDTKSEIYQKISDLEDEIRSIETQINEATDESAKTDLEGQKKDLLEQIVVLRRAQQYVFTTVDDMEQIKSTYEKELNQDSFPLTLDNLNFDVFGYLYYTRDGYEDVMNIDNLDDVDYSYFTMLDTFEPDSTLDVDEYILKSCATDHIILAVRIETDEDITKLDSVLSYKENLINAYNMDQEGGYYRFLLSRVDLLSKFPSMTVTTEDGTEITGDVIDVVNEEDESGTGRVLLMVVRENISYFSDKTIFSGSLQTYSSNFYIVPSSAVVTDDNGSYVTVVSDYNKIKKVVSVEVYTYVDGKAFLKVSDNPSLSTGTEIMQKGEEPDDSE
jgi:hypothetical protein